MAPSNSRFSLYHNPEWACSAIFWPFSSCFSPERCFAAFFLTGAEATKIGLFSRDEKFSSRCCHVFVDSLVSFLEALIKRSLEKEKRNKKEHYDEHFCNRCNRRARKISCAQISQGWVYRFGDEPHT